MIIEFHELPGTVEFRGFSGIYTGINATRNLPFGYYVTFFNGSAIKEGGGGEGRAIKGKKTEGLTLSRAGGGSG